MLGFGKKSAKVLTFLERPYHEEIEKYCKNNHIPNQYWLGQRFGIPLEGALDENMHSFYVVKKEDNDAVVDLKHDNELLKKIADEIKKRRRNANEGFSLKGIFIEVNAKLGQAIMGFLKKPEKTFKIDDLSELPKVFEQIDY